MKAMLLTLIGCIAISMSGYAVSCGDSGGCGSSGGDGSCNVCGEETTVSSDCLCTDPACSRLEYGCLSPETCCQVFGNVGGMSGW